VPIAVASIVSSFTFFAEMAGKAARISSPATIKPMRTPLEDFVLRFLFKDIEFSP
jgi:hypothetical protein